MDTSYEGTLREVSTDKGVLRYHEAGTGPDRQRLGRPRRSARSWSVSPSRSSITRKALSS